MQTIVSLQQTFLSLQQKLDTVSKNEGFDRKILVFEALKA